MATCLTQQISGAEDSAQVTCRSGPAMLAAARHPASLVGLGSESAQYACDSPQLHSSGANNEDAHHVTSSSRSHSAAPPPPPMDQSRCSGQAQAVQSPGTAAEQQQEQQQQEQQQEQQQQEQQSPTASPACTAAGAPLSPPLTWDGARATTPLPRLEPLSPPSPREGAAVAAEYDAYLARFAAGDTIAQRWHRLAAAGRLEALKDEWEDAQHDLMLSRLQAGLGISGRGTRRQRDEEEEPHDGDAPRQVCPHTRQSSMLSCCVSCPVLVGSTPTTKSKSTYIHTLTHSLACTLQLPSARCVRGAPLQCWVTSSWRDREHQQPRPPAAVRPLLVTAMAGLVASAAA
jgi:hypothetical protein